MYTSGDFAAYFNGKQLLWFPVGFLSHNILSKGKEFSPISTQKRKNLLHGEQILFLG